jgi:hypothetical protein
MRDMSAHRHLMEDVIQRQGGNVLLKRGRRRRSFISAVQSLLSLTGCVMAVRNTGSKVILHFIIK